METNEWNSIQPGEFLRLEFSGRIYRVISSKTGQKRGMPKILGLERVGGPTTEGVISMDAPKYCHLCDQDGNKL